MNPSNGKKDSMNVPVFSLVLVFSFIQLLFGWSDGFTTTVAFGHHHDYSVMKIGLTSFLHRQKDVSRFQHLAHEDGNAETDENYGVRLNKCLKSSHSRRQADALIQAGRVKVNGEVGMAGQRVIPGKDIVTLDGKTLFWEELNTPLDDNSNQNNMQDDDTVFTYIKYWKPRGVTCTTDLSIPSNIIHAIGKSPRSSSRDKLPKMTKISDHRIFPVGRLDKDSTGLILLTSDGRLPNAISRSIFKRPKVYKVRVDRPLKKQHLQQLREGVVITTVAQRDGKKAKPLTAKTLPCPVHPFGPREFSITLMEGRNRQIRKMCDALGYTVRDLHRVEINDITLERLKPATWDYLSASEMEIIQSVLKTYTNNNNLQN